jgi:predicted ATPase
VAEALAVPERAGLSLRAAVCESAARRRLLVLLDNCEHLIEAAAELVEELLAVAPGVAVLATSREPLGVSGELVRLLGPLGASDEEGAESPAVELFVARAHDAGADLDVTVASTRAAIMDICAHLDGMPLAIELAAGRCAALPPTEITRRLGDRLKLLTGGRRTAAARHRTLAATIDWSYDLLDEAKRVLFRRLGVFTGSFSLDAAETVGSAGGLDVVDVLGDLVARSMVAAAGARYRLLETLREYAAQRLEESGERAALEEAEAARCLALVGDVAAGLKGAGEADWADLLANELDNLRACWRRSVAAGDVGTALGCFAPLPEWSGLPSSVTQELASWAEPTLSLAGATEHPLYVGACLLGSRGRYNAFDRRGAQGWLDRAESAGPVPARFAAVLSTRRAVLAALAGSDDDASRHITNAKAATDPAVDPYEWVYVEAFDLFILSPRSPDDAAARYPKALVAAKTAGSPHLMMSIMTSWAELLLFYTRPPRLDLCRDLAQEALIVGARCRNRQFVNSAISKLAADGRHPDALRAVRDFLVAEQRRGYHQQLWWHLRCLLIACHNRALHLRYAQLTAAVYDGPLSMALEPTANELDAQAAARQALGQELYDEATAASRQHDVDDAIRLALDIIDDLVALSDNA